MNTKTEARIAVAIARLKVRELEGRGYKGSKGSKKLNAAIAKLNELVDVANETEAMDFSIVEIDGKLKKEVHEFKKVGGDSEPEGEEPKDVDSSSSEPKDIDSSLELEEEDSSSCEQLSLELEEVKPVTIKPWWTNPELNLACCLEGSPDNPNNPEPSDNTLNKHEEPSNMVYSYYMAVKPPTGSPNQIEYCNFKMVEGMVNVLEAEKGTGKTQCIKKYLDSLDSSKRALVVSHRVLLNISLAIDFVYTCYKDVDEKSKLHLITKLVCSPEHLKYVSYGDVVPYDVVVLDEAEQALRHIVKSTTVKDKKLVLDTLAKLCNYADTVILADANPSLCVDKFTEMLANKEHSVKPKQKKHHYNPCKPRQIRKDRFELVGSDDEWNAVLKAYVLDKKKFVVISDSKKKTKEAYEAVVGYGVDKDKVLLINADIKNPVEAVEGLLRNPKQCDIVIYSPTLGTGFSIEEHTHHFETGLVHFKGWSLTAESCSQMLARFRGLSHYIGFIGERANEFKLPVNYDELLNYYVENRIKKGDKTMHLTNEYGQLDIKFIDKIVVAAKAGKNLSDNDFRALMLKVLNDEGFTVVPYDCSELEIEVKQPKVKKPKLPELPKQPDPIALEDTARIVKASKEQLDEHNKSQLYKAMAEGTIIEPLRDGNDRDMLVVGIVSALGVFYGLGFEVNDLRDAKGDLPIDKTLVAKFDALKPLYKDVTGKNLDGTATTRARKLIEYVGLVKIRKRLSTVGRKWVHYVGGVGIDELLVLLG